MHYIPVFEGFYMRQGSHDGYLADFVEGVIFYEPRKTESLSMLERAQVPIATFRPSTVSVGLNTGSTSWEEETSVSYFYDPRTDTLYYRRGVRYAQIPLEPYRRLQERDMPRLAKRLREDEKNFPTVLLEDLDEIFKDAIPE